jgi:hypothetical protein
MIVMDGERAVAKARKNAMGVWTLTGIECSWVDPRARTPLRDDFPTGFKDLYSRHPEFLTVKTKGEARKLLQALAECKPYKAGQPTKAQPKVKLPGRHKKKRRERITPFERSGVRYDQSSKISSLLKNSLNE